jgi:hypothetical protein
VLLDLPAQLKNFPFSSLARGFCHRIEASDELRRFVHHAAGK